MQSATTVRTGELLMAAEKSSHRKSSVLFSVVVGVLMSVLGAVPAAILVASVYGFPMIMVGWVSGPELIATRGIGDFVYRFPRFAYGISLMVFVYGILGGYIILATAGGIGGWLTHPKGEFNFRQVLRSNLAVAVVVDLLYAIVVATLDPIGLFWRQ